MRYKFSKGNNKRRSPRRLTASERMIEAVKEQIIDQRLGYEITPAYYAEKHGVECMTEGGDGRPDV